MPNNLTLPNFYFSDCLRKYSLIFPLASTSLFTSSSQRPVRWTILTISSVKYTAVDCSYPSLEHVTFLRNLPFRYSFSFDSCSKVSDRFCVILALLNHVSLKSTHSNGHDSKVLYIFFYKHNVYKHIQAQISKKLSIF